MSESDSELKAENERLRSRMESIDDERITTIFGKLDALHELVVRVDRLEQSQQTSGKAFWIVLPMAVAGFGKALWDVVTKKG